MGLMKSGKTVKSLVLILFLAAVMALTACLPQQPQHTDATTSPAQTSGERTLEPLITLSPSETANTPAPTPTLAPTPTPAPTPDPEKLEEYKSFIGQNGDFIGYVSVSETKIAYPVVQPQDDLTYVYYNFAGKQSSEGAIFLGVDASLPGNVKNMVLHGHNMKESSVYGKMFGYLHDYSTNSNRAGSKGLDYYKKHPVIDFNTIYGDAAYKIFATIYVDVSEPEDRKDPLFYYLFNDFESDGQFMEFVTELQRRSMITTTVDVNEDDELLMLSTCDTNGLFKGSSGETLGHFIVIARKIRDGESRDVDVGGAEIAKNPLMDQRWYDKKYSGTLTKFDDRDMNAPWFRYPK